MFLIVWVLFVIPENNMYYQTREGCGQALVQAEERWRAGVCFPMKVDSRRLT